MKNIQRISLKVVREELEDYATKKISKSGDAVEILKDLLQHQDREHFIVLLLDSKNVINATHTVGIGSLNSAIIHPREVFKAALLANASAIILAHNHPSGDSTPSNEDLAITSRLVEAGDILGIRVLDHIIIGDDYYSMAERGELVEKKKWG
jgi:DNA repair protein RadC